MKMDKHDSQHDETRVWIKEMTDDDFMEKIEKLFKSVALWCTSSSVILK